VVLQSGPVACAGKARRGGPASRVGGATVARKCKTRSKKRPHFWGRKTYPKMSRKRSLRDKSKQNGVQKTAPKSGPPKSEIGAGVADMDLSALVAGDDHGHVAARLVVFGRNGRARVSGRRSGQRGSGCSCTWRERAACRAAHAAKMKPHKRKRSRVLNRIKRLDAAAGCSSAHGGSDASGGAHQRGSSQASGSSASTG
jgi:hypothetical protein